MLDKSSCSTKLAIITASFVFSMASFAFAQNSSDKTKLDIVDVKSSKIDPDVEGKEEVFLKNVSNVYVGKEYLERYHTDAAGDILKGLSGVYAVGTRTAGSSITPNIRGIVGKGRIPVTIDGTEQTVDVWLNNYGAGDRNYLDPALFRSISVEKSPGITRGVKSGVGGSMTIKTIEADDVVQKGNKFGINFQVSSAGGTKKNGVDMNKFFGMDYHDVPGAFSDTHYLTSVPVRFKTDPARYRKTKDNFNFNDNSFVLSSGFKTDMVDGLIAYSYRDKGNYFAGKKGISGYMTNPYLDKQIKAIGLSSVAYTPNMAKILRANEEVLNTHTKTKTVLFKSNLYPTEDQKLGFQYMNMKSDFGEMNPLFSALALGMYEGIPGIMREMPSQVRHPHSEVKTNTFKLSYDYNPENSRWIDLKTNIWYVKATSRRHQNGGSPYGAREYDEDYDEWISCNIHGVNPDPSKSNYCQTDPIASNPIMPPKKPAVNADGYNLFPASLQTGESKRMGIDLSNQFAITDDLKLTFSADIQHEKIKETSYWQEQAWLMIPMFQSATALVGPRDGRRQEWGSSLSLDWNPTEKLHIQAGLRYHKFWAIDDRIIEERKKRDPGSFFKKEEYPDIGVYIKYHELATDEETRLAKIYDGTTIDPNMSASQARRALRKIGEEKFGRKSRNLIPEKGSRDKDAYYWGGPRTSGVYTFIPLKNNKYLSSHNPFRNGEKDIDEMVENPQGLSGKYHRYLVRSGCENVPWCGKEIVSKRLTEEERWELPERQRGHAFAPMIAISYDIFDSGRVFGRYAQMTRFPSIHESSTASYTALHQSYDKFDLKPERSMSWEIGYAHDFSSYFDGIMANARLTYYSNTIKDLIATDNQFRMIQHDKKINTGLEFVSRFDSGKYSADLGVTYRLTQKTCDEDFGHQYDWWRRGMPKCITGGFGKTKFFGSLQPKYSVNLDLGTRQLDNKLKLGLRAIYHGKIDNKDIDKLFKTGHSKATEATGRPYFWNPVTVFDIYGSYQINRNFMVKFNVNNVLDQYYLDPMANVPAPAPGRSLRVGVEGRF